MFAFILSFFAALRVFCGSRSAAALEVLALRQQLAVLRRKRPRPALRAWDRIFWTGLRRVWPRWSEVLVIVQPETVISWHRAGFRRYWRWRSRRRGGRPRVNAETRALIKRMARENPDWGAPRVHGELLKLGLTISERSVARYLRSRERRGDPKQRWLAFLQNHREAICAMDFFTVPTLTFQLLYGMFVIEHGRRRIIHCNVTRHPTADWVVQQLREAFPEACPYPYVILDRDTKWDDDVMAFLQATGMQVKRTSVRAPWQNGVAERWVGSCRREMLDHVIPVNEDHLRRLLRGYIHYYQEDRPHNFLAQDAPQPRLVENKPGGNARVVALPRVGGLHHRYAWRSAA